MPDLTIGGLARRARVKVSTIRYYERRGLLPESPRTDSGYRQFPEDTVRRVRFIRRAKELGFTLKEIAQLLAFADGETAGCQEVRDFTRRKLTDIDRQLKHLRSLKRVLADLADRCTGAGPLSDCPIIESLTHDE